MRPFPLADYRVRDALRVGGLCQAYQADKLDAAGTTSVVLKQLLPLFASDPSVVERWLAKAGENAELNHPGCIRVFDWGWADNAAYMAIDEVRGVGLKALLRGVHASQKRVPVDVAVSLARGILEALAQGHERFPVLSHLDVSPYSVIVRPDGSQVLTEFGMWSALDPSDAARVRFDRGRSQYLAPELAWSASGDARSDVFSCGALLYELLVGERPFQGATQLVIAMAIAEGKRKPIHEHEHGQGLPPMLCEIVEHMLAHDAASRFQTARAALNALTSAHPLDGSERAHLAALTKLAGAPEIDASRLPSPIPARPVVKTTFFKARNAGAARPSESSGALEAVRNTPMPPPVFPPASSEVHGQPMPSMAPLLRPEAEPPTSPHLAKVLVPAAQDFGPPPSTPRTPVVPPLVAPPPLVTGPAAPGGPGYTMPPPSLHAAKSAVPPYALVPPPAPPDLVNAAPPYSFAPPPVQPSFAPGAGTSAPPYGLHEEAPRGQAPSGPPPPAWTPVSQPAPTWQPAVNAPIASANPVAFSPKRVDAQASATGGEGHSAHAPAFEPLPVSSRDDGRWRDPSHTLFQMKSYAAGESAKAASKMPLPVAVALAVVFGFAVVAGGYLLFRLAQ